MTLLRKLLFCKPLSVLRPASFLTTASAVTVSFLLGALLCGSIANAQEKDKGENEETKAKVSGSIAHTSDFSKKNIEFTEIETSLYERVVPPQPPVPPNWADMNTEDRTSWWTVFQTTDEGKKFVADRDRLIKNASVFEVIYEDDGSFDVYDVPAGTYGMQGRIDNEIDGVLHAFEVFGKIVVEEGVEVVQLQPIPIEITPLYKSGQAAPELTVKSADESNIGFDSDQLKGKYVFLNFWSANDPDNGYQKQIQKMYEELNESQNVELLSIAVDDEPEKAVEAIAKNEFVGLQAFTNGWDHEAVTSYGVRSTPSGWLISPDGKIMMTQYEFYQAVKVKPSVAEVISDRITGKDKPTPAQPAPADAKGKPDLAEEVKAANRQNIQKLLNLITLYQRRTNKAVESEEALREWIKTSDNIAPNLKMMTIEIEKFDEYLVSERDGEKFDVRWGLLQERGAASEPYIFEKTGVDGERQVIWTSGGGITDVDAAEYEKLKERAFAQDDK
jgi:hypothetical protein